jgi:hypothetical protein
MTGCINKVYTVITPCTCGSRSGDGNTPLLFLLHPVHGSRTLINFAHPIGFMGIKKYPLCRCRFTGIYVCHDADIAKIM